MDPDSSQTPRPAAPTRSEGLWFSDGGLILQAEDRLFRVAGSPDNQPLIEGCPVVTLHDSPKDVDYFLRAIFDSGFFERPPAPTTLDIVSGVLRLSTKYDVGYLRRRALLHLATVSACTLEEHTSIASTATFDSKRGLMSRAMLASEFNLQWAQLPAMYRISTCTVEQIMDGALTLSPPFALQRTCIAAHCSLRLAQTTETFSFLRPLSVPGCHFPDTCHHLRHNLYEKLCSHQRVDPHGGQRPRHVNERRFL
ncbi:hypothetical protein FB45DRAFT_1029773 [Roridomyces roridus]|uniref:BTB domain-containing protein n=1 Tax=Roridomyces roridus TaxID=1738132 RepID=A0AAD7FMN8_9AGAR|nr:hypothetical protein FB45DRAFT_1029773 [Roridomyces roridus]